MQQKREIESRIRELKNKSVICGCAKLDVEHYPTNLPDRHYIAIQSNESYLGGFRPRWRTVANGNTSEEVIELIPTIINDLQALYNKFHKGEQDGESNQESVT